MTFPCIPQFLFCFVFPTGWFGIRKNFVDFVLDNCPILQEYVNVSYRTEDQEESAAAEGGHSKHRTTPTTVVRTPDPKLYPYEDIYAPD